MKINSSVILNEVKIISPNIFYDYRGEYVETWNSEAYSQFNVEFKQDDVSVSIKNTLRGLHGDYETWKLVQCLYGSLLLAIVDARPESKNYLKYDLISINDKNRTQVLIPPGFANGHLVMTNFGIFSYKQSTLYSGANNQFTIRWNDPKINIDWPINNPILSSRDRNAKQL